MCIRDSHSTEYIFNHQARLQVKVPSFIGTECAHCEILFHKMNSTTTFQHNFILNMVRTLQVGKLFCKTRNIISLMLLQNNSGQALAITLRNQSNIHLMRLAHHTQPFGSYYINIYTWKSHNLTMVTRNYSCR